MIEKPIIPDAKGNYICECQQKFQNVFDFLAHNGVEYEWGVRISDNWSFDMFEFMLNLDFFLSKNDLQSVYEAIQTAALTMLNASEDKFMEFMEEVTVAGEMEGIYEGLEKLLRKEEK